MSTARRFLLQVQRPTSSGFSTYDHIVHVAEYDDKDFGHLSDSQARRKFRDRVRNIEKGNPTRRITMERIREATIPLSFHEQYDYKPYVGGAGPTDEQFAELQRVLMTALSDHNIPFKLRCREEDTYIVVGNKEVIYDRWGYCSYDGQLDQADLETTFNC